MTHESFKQIMDWCEAFTPEEINLYLDGLLESVVLDNFFEDWKKGKQKKIFRDIEDLNQLLENSKRNSPEFIPEDAKLERKKENRNLRK